jgi:hypothetical protein
MLKLIRNILLLVVLVALLITGIGIALSTFGWGDSTFYTKSHYYLSNKEKFNAIYVGGSLEYRHIDPFVIDSTVAEHGIRLKSFNLGNDGYNLPLQVWVVENMLKKAGDHLDYIFLSLSSDPLFYKGILHTKEWNYWQNPKSVLFSVRVLHEMPIPQKQKTQFSRFYVSSLAENLLKFGMMGELLQFHFVKAAADSLYLGQRKNGYFPYDDEEAYLSLRNDLPDEIVSKMENNEISKQDYRRNQAKRDSLTTLWTQAFETYAVGTKPLPLYLKTYQNLHKACAAKGIRLIFVMPPKGRTDYHLLMAIYENLPDDSKINLADPRDFPEFFSLENGYNYHHMNAKGSHLYSQIYGERLVELLLK